MEAKEVLDMFLERLREIREVYPEFGYSPKAGWVDETDDVINWNEE